MRHVVANITAGKLCVANVGAAAVTAVSQMTLEQNARIFTAIAGGVWFSLQAIFFLVDRFTKKR